MTPKPGDIVRVTLIGEVMDKNGLGAEGYLWVQVLGYGPTQVPIKGSASIHVAIVKAAPLKEERHDG
jgi:hypothetical protein